MLATQMDAYTYDAHDVRYELVEEREGREFNWIFLPGGPGADSSYFKGLIELLELPGKVWLVDLPGNGSNVASITDFDQWYRIFPEVIARFDNPVLVGHSFGGMFPLCFPELEEMLKGFVILNSTPSFWLEDAVGYAKQFDLPDLTEEMQAFTEDPNEQTFQTALAACIPYYFPKATLELGRKLLLNLPFQFRPAVWWQQKVIATGFDAEWIPEDVPTMIVGGRYDCICPHTLFEGDARFKRENISYHFIEEGGHFPWIEAPENVVDCFNQFIAKLERD